MALLGQTLGQTSPGSNLWALACHLNARGYTKHPPQTYAKVSRARQRKILFRKWCMISLCPRERESYLEVADMWAQMDGYKCVCWLNPKLPYSVVPSKPNVAWRNTAVVIISKDMHYSLSLLIFYLQLVEDIGIFMESKLFWYSADTSWINILLLDLLIPRCNTFLLLFSMHHLFSE